MTQEEFNAMLQGPSHRASPAAITPASTEEGAT